MEEVESSLNVIIAVSVYRQNFDLLGLEIMCEQNYFLDYAWYRLFFNKSCIKKALVNASESQK